MKHKKKYQFEDGQIPNWRGLSKPDDPNFPTPTKDGAPRRFKAGQRVKVIGPQSSDGYRNIKTGTVGTIKCVENWMVENPSCWGYMLEEDTGWVYHDDDLEPYENGLQKLQKIMQESCQLKCDKNVAQSKVANATSVDN